MTVFKGASQITAYCGYDLCPTLVNTQTHRQIAIDILYFYLSQLSYNE